MICKIHKRFSILRSSSDDGKFKNYFSFMNIYSLLGLHSTTTAGAVQMKNLNAKGHDLILLYKHEIFFCKCILHQLFLKVMLFYQRFLSTLVLLKHSTTNHRGIKTCVRNENCVNHCSAAGSSNNSEIKEMKEMPKDNEKGYIKALVLLKHSTTNHRGIKTCVRNENCVNHCSAAGSSNNSEIKEMKEMPKDNEKGYIKGEKCRNGDK
ncbi:hypothetical protein EGR_01265 [Echinococcus granulosus]|uniref:Uncharacterized protein n=1 Tax=Echinococcus granulosus TaxID=6210 RepID=W6UZZ0_ECHGR|nr:hypothetical protein EGR_01265 [Echinococcus granulosus]EUB64137.1 hypothetical protein EGR_01265 [Echinococcus granulosus]